MSIAQTWLGSVISMRRSRYGILWPGSGLVVIERLYPTATSESSRAGGRSCTLVASRPLTIREPARETPDATTA